MRRFLSCLTCICMISVMLAACTPSGTNQQGGQQQSVPGQPGPGLGNNNNIIAPDGTVDRGLNNGGGLLKDMNGNSTNGVGGGMTNGTGGMSNLGQGGPRSGPVNGGTAR